MSKQKLTPSAKGWIKQQKIYLKDCQESINDSKQLIKSCEMDAKIANKRIELNKLRLLVQKQNITIGKKTLKDYINSFSK